jgi:hypothetical protein
MDIGMYMLNDIWMMIDSGCVAFNILGIIYSINMNSGNPFEPVSRTP